MRISVLIPTYKRPDYLAKALRGLENQQRPADQIVLGVRDGDSETRAFLSSHSPPLELEIATTDEPGVLASMSAAANRVNGELVCLLDDDAEPLPDWLQKIEAQFSAEPSLGLLGGRDLLQDDPALRSGESLLDQVGRFTWYGRLVGNHHRGAGRSRPAEIVKGCNAAIRADLLHKIGFAKGLRGQGAQVHWELALALDVAREGALIRYDPEIQVLHHVAPRHDSDLIHRGHFSAEGLYDLVWNEHHVVATRANTWQKFSHLLWALLVGTRTAPGLAQFLRLGVEGDPHRNSKFKTTLRAILTARTQPFRRPPAA